MAEDILTPFFKNFFLPQYESSFRGDFEEVRVLYFTSRQASPIEMKIKAYPFMTLYDLKIMIYQQFRKEISAHPAFQSLLLPQQEEVEDEEEYSRGPVKELDDDLRSELSNLQPTRRAAAPVEEDEDDDALSYFAKLAED